MKQFYPWAMHNPIKGEDVVVADAAAHEAIWNKANAAQRGQMPMPPHLDPTFDPTFDDRVPGATTTVIGYTDAQVDEKIAEALDKAGKGGISEQEAADRVDNAVAEAVNEERKRALGNTNKAVAEAVEKALAEERARVAAASKPAAPPADESHKDPKGGQTGKAK